MNIWCKWPGRHANLVHCCLQPPIKREVIAWQPRAPAREVRQCSCDVLVTGRRQLVHRLLSLSCSGWLPTALTCRPGHVLLHRILSRAAGPALAHRRTARWGCQSSICRHLGKCCVICPAMQQANTCKVCSRGAQVAALQGMAPSSLPADTGRHGLADGKPAAFKPKLPGQPWHIIP